jgi:hypothetical protein
MATRDDVLDAIDRIRTTAGAGEATRLAQAALTLPLPPAGYDSVLDRLYAAYPAIGDQQQGRGPQAIRAAETALAQQLSASAQFDRNILEALRHAHKTTVEGRRRLDDLETEVAAAAASWDLSTAAGAREFQRFLITKLGEIIATVEQANDDDRSKGALAAALTGLYHSTPAEPGDADPSDRSPEQATEPAPPADGDLPQSCADPESDAYLEPLDDDTMMAVPDAAQRLPQFTTPMAPGLGSEGPGFGGLPAGMPAGFPWTGLNTSPGGDELSDEAQFLPEDAGGTDPPDGADDTETGGDDSAPDQGERGPVVVRLPDGETTTVSDPRLAAAMQAVADGQPVVEAFRSQGIDIPPPGTPVAAAVDAARLQPGDIGVFTDRHALAVGDGKALLDGQVHLVTNMRGPSFLGWQHPPAFPREPEADASPVETRPASAINASLTLKNPPLTGIVDEPGR